MGELVLHDSAGSFLLVHGSDEFLSLAREPAPSGEVPLVRFAPQHAPLLAAAIELCLAEAGRGALVAHTGVDELKVELVDRPGGRRARVANLARRRPGVNEPEALELDREVAASVVAALRGPRLAPIARPPAGEVFRDRAGLDAGVESAGGQTTVSSRTERAWARASFPDPLRRVVAAVMATVVGNPAAGAVRLAHVAWAGHDVLVERVATAAGRLPFVMANARTGRPVRPRRAVRLSDEMASWVIRRLARDDDLAAITEGAPAAADAEHGRSAAGRPPLRSAR